MVVFRGYGCTPLFPVNRMLWAVKGVSLCSRLAFFVPSDFCVMWMAWFQVPGMGLRQTVRSLFCLWYSADITFTNTNFFVKHFFTWPYASFVKIYFWRVRITERATEKCSLIGPINTFSGKWQGSARLHSIKMVPCSSLVASISILTLHPRKTPWVLVSHVLSIFF